MENEGGGGREGWRKGGEEQVEDGRDRELKRWRTGVGDRKDE